jgi:hypothetical protein
LGNTWSAAYLISNILYLISYIFLVGQILVADLRGMLDERKNANRLLWHQVTALAAILRKYQHTATSSAHAHPSVSTSGTGDEFDSSTTPKSAASEMCTTSTGMTDEAIELEPEPSQAARRRIHSADDAAPVPASTFRERRRAVWQQRRRGPVLRTIFGPAAGSAPDAGADALASSATNSAVSLL